MSRKYGQPVYQTVQSQMSQPEKILHAVLILVTFGAWTPVYLGRKRKIRRVSTTYVVRGA